MILHTGVLLTNRHDTVYQNSRLGSGTGKILFQTLTSTTFYGVVPSPRVPDPIVRYEHHDGSRASPRNTWIGLLFLVPSTLGGQGGQTPFIYEVEE